MLGIFIAFLGAVTLCVGLGLAWFPLGVIAAGLFLLAAGLLVNFPERKKAGET